MIIQINSHQLEYEISSSKSYIENNAYISSKLSVLKNKQAYINKIAFNTSINTLNIFNNGDAN